MFVFEKRHAYAYECVKPFIKCQCKKARWKERFQPTTGLTTVYCANCQRTMTTDQYNTGAIEYKFKYGPLYNT